MRLQELPEVQRTEERQRYWFPSPNSPTHLHHYNTTNTGTGWDSVRYEPLHQTYQAWLMGCASINLYANWIPKHGLIQLITLIKSHDRQFHAGGITAYTGFKCYLVEKRYSDQSAVRRENTQDFLLYSWSTWAKLWCSKITFVDLSSKWVADDLSKYNAIPFNTTKCVFQPRFPAATATKRQSNNNPRYIVRRD